MSPIGCISMYPIQKEKEEVPSDSDTDPTFSAPTSQSKIVDQVNVSLQELGESPIDKKKIQSKKYSGSKIKK